MFTKLLKDRVVLTVGGMMLGIWIIYAFCWVTGSMPGPRRYSFTLATREEIESGFLFVVGITVLWSPILIRRIWQLRRDGGRH